MQTIKYDGFTVRVVKSKRRKSMALKVNKDGASIHIPSLLPIYFAEKFVHNKSSWISNKLKQQAEHITVEKQFTDGEVFMLLGKSYTFHLHEAPTKPTITLNGDSINCHARLNKATKIAISAAMTTWYKQQASHYLTARTHALSTETKLSAKSITVKTYRARWGSCTIRGDIQFNWKLILAPPEVIDYVIIHELCHTKHHNHSKQFWQLVTHFRPDYSNNRHWLKINGHSLEL